MRSQERALRLLSTDPYPPTHRTIMTRHTHKHHSLQEQILLCAPRPGTSARSRFCARPSLVPRPRRLRSLPGLRVCGPSSRALAAAGRAFPAEPRRGVFVDKQKRLLFWFSSLSFLFFCLLLNLPPRSSSLTSLSPPHFPFPFVCFSFSLSLPLFCPSFSVSPPSILDPSLPLGSSLSLGRPSRVLRCPWARVAPAPCTIFPDSAASFSLFRSPGGPSLAGSVRLPRRLCRCSDLFASPGRIRRLTEPRNRFLPGRVL